MTNKGLQKRIAMIFFKLSVIPKENASMNLCKSFGADHLGSNHSHLYSQIMIVNVILWMVSL